MLDENLPTFYLRSSTDNVKHHAAVHLSHHGSDAAPAYSLRHPDPALPGSKNRYAVALYDSYNPEILFGEVLLIPQWTQPSKEETRFNSGVAPPPQPILPTKVILQLYNPDQQIKMEWIPGTWNTAPYWGFEMPVQSFRQPSSSAIDRIQSDPTASENTPMLGFKWKKDGKLSKDYICTLSGKSTNPDGSKKKHKEPDITVALFKHFKEITLYEPNLSRVEMEDPKGLEVVLLLGAIVIREVFNSNLGEAFNISDAAVAAVPSTSPNQAHRKHRRPSHPPPSQPPRNSSSDPRPPPTDPRTQWELDMEEARLKKQVAHEERERRRREEAETRRVQKMVQNEEQQRREKQKAIDRETERLKKVYGKGQRPSSQQVPPAKPPRHPNAAVTSYPPAPIQRPHSAAPAPYLANNLRPTPRQQNLGPYLHPSGFGAPSSSTIFPAGGHADPPQSQPRPQKKSSFWHIGKKDDNTSRLSKQRSVVF